MMLLKKKVKVEKNINIAFSLQFLDTDIFVLKDLWATY